MKEATCMKKLIVFILAVITISCTSSSTPAPVDPCTTLNSVPPYDSFNENLTFSLPSNAPTTFKDLTFGQASAWYKTFPATAPSQYSYTLYTAAGNVWDGSDGTIPPSTLLGVGTSGNTIIITFSGNMTRSGTNIPSGYTKDNSCDKWDTKAGFTYTIKFDPISKTLISAVVTVAGTGYAATYDCSTAVKATFNVPVTATDNTYTFLLSNTPITNATKTHVLNMIALNITIYRVG